MAELIRTMNCAIKIEKVKDVIEINIASAGKTNPHVKKCETVLSCQKRNLTERTSICSAKSISSVFPIGHAGEVKLANGLLALLKGE